ncbi:MAG: response regulator transcription factor [Bacteroidetes bacterium]|nr:response regulator transcription factor [Bacteroidota bacterium]
MKTLKILVADDHEGFRRTLSSFLKSQYGIELVGEAADGREAVEKAKYLNPDLILMDIHMPGQNGIEATKTIKNHLPLTRVIILSMDTSEISRKNVNECADGFIAKSSVKSHLLSILPIERQMQKRSITANLAVV